MPKKFKWHNKEFNVWHNWQVQCDRGLSDYMVKRRTQRCVNFGEGYKYWLHYGPYGNHYITVTL